MFSCKASDIGIVMAFFVVFYFGHCLLEEMLFHTLYVWFNVTKQS